MFRNPDANILIGFFAGSGIDYASGDPALSDVRIPLPGSETEAEENGIDTSFLDITQSLDLAGSSSPHDLTRKDPLAQQHVYGYDGCHRRGGGLFAFGIEEPAEHFYQQIINTMNARKSRSKEKWQLVLAGHSRGCLSAMLVAEKINANPELKNKIDVILDLRDPVPGNLQIGAKTNFTETTIANQLADLSHCTCIKEAYITILESGITGIGYDVLVPQLHPKTKLNLEFLPGSHCIQERFEDGYRISKHDSTKLTKHPYLYLIGLLKSLQITHEHGGHIDYAKCLKKINNYLIQIEVPDEIVSPLYAALNEKYQSGKTKEGFNQFLKMLQLYLYDELLKIYTQPDDVSSSYVDPLLAGQSHRDIHFGGTFAVTAPNPQHANCLNMRHAALKQEMQVAVDGPGYYPKPLLGFKPETGVKPWKKRRDLNNASFIKIPSNLFQQSYQRIMLILDQQIESNLMLPNNMNLYIETIKKYLKSIALSRVSNTQKRLNMEIYLLHIYWEIRTHEGVTESRLRRGLEWILNSPGLLGIKSHYGISFPEKPENDEMKHQDLFNLSTRLSDNIMRFSLTAENHPDLYRHGMKFLVELDQVQSQTKRKTEAEQLRKMVSDLLHVGNESQNQEMLFETFKIKLLRRYAAIRQHESSKMLSSFRVSTLGNCIEKFLRHDLKITDVPHQYNPTQIQRIINNIAPQRVPVTVTPITNNDVKKIRPATPPLHTIKTTHQVNLDSEETSSSSTSPTPIKIKNTPEFKVDTTLDINIAVPNHEPILRTITQEELIDFICKHREKALPGRNSFDWHNQLKEHGFKPLFKDINFDKIKSAIMSTYGLHSQATLYWDAGKFENISFVSCENVPLNFECTFNHCLFEQCRFQSCAKSVVMQDCAFKNSEFNNIIFSGDMLNVSFGHCQFFRSNLKNIQGENVHVTNCKITKCRWENIPLIETEYETNKVDSITGFKETAWETKHTQRFPIPRVVCLYDERQGVTNTNKVIDFYRQRNINVILVSPEEGEKHPIFQHKDLIHGIILPGGHDVPQHDNDIRKKFEIYLLDLACEKDRKIPVLGVCRGHQLIGSRFGGTIKDLPHQHSGKSMLYSSEDDGIVHRRLQQKHEKFQRNIAQGQSESTVLDKKQGNIFIYAAHCEHTQGVFFENHDKRVKITMKSNKDNTPEALEIDRHIITYQHHHEALASSPKGKVAKALLNQFANMVRNYCQLTRQKIEIKEPTSPSLTSRI